MLEENVTFKLLDLIFHHCDIISFDLNYYYSSYSIELCGCDVLFLEFTLKTQPLLVIVHLHALICSHCLISAQCLDS